MLPQSISGTVNLIYFVNRKSISGTVILIYFVNQGTVPVIDDIHFVNQGTVPVIDDTYLQKKLHQKFGFHQNDYYIYGYP